MAFMLLWNSSVRIYESQAYMKLDVTRERISRILELTEIPLLFQPGFSLVNATVICAISPCNDMLKNPRHERRTKAM